jgi:ribonuclease P protein component
VKRTIKSRKDINAIFDEGTKIPLKNVIVIIKSKAEQRGQSGRVAYIAGKKVGNAPVRNRAKRVLRAAVSQLPSFPQGLDIVFIARNRTPDCSPYQIEEELDKMFRKKGLYEE